MVSVCRVVCVSAECSVNTRLLREASNWSLKKVVDGVRLQGCLCLSRVFSVTSHRSLFSPSILDEACHKTDKTLPALTAFCSLDTSRIRLFDVGTGGCFQIWPLLAFWPVRGESTTFISTP